MQREIAQWAAALLGADQNDALGWFDQSKAHQDPQRFMMLTVERVESFSGNWSTSSHKTCSDHISYTHQTTKQNGNVLT